MIELNEQADGTVDRPDDIEERHQFVTFSLSGQTYCIDIMSVREIRMTQSIAAMPGAAEYVLGVINLRGSIVPVCDLHQRFGEGKTEVRANHPVVIVWIDGQMTGILVDEVLDIISVSSSDISEIPDTEKNKSNPFFEGLITQDDAMLIIVSLDNLFEEEALAKQLELA
ncbi:MAG: chemotaxis protein CheW [Hyphomicrobiaceae bacterium]